MNENHADQGGDEFGRFLVDEELITPSQFEAAREHSLNAKVPFENALIELEIMAEEAVTRARALYLDIPYVNLRDLQIDRSVTSMVDVATARRHSILPIGRKSDGTLRLAVVDWTEEIRDAAAKIAYQHSIRIAPALATAAQVRLEIDKSYSNRVPVGAGAGIAASLGAASDGGPAIMNNKSNDAIPPNPSRPGGSIQAPGGGIPAPGGSQSAGRSGVPAVVPPAQSGVPAVPQRWAAPGAAPATTTSKRPSDVFAANVAATQGRGKGPQEEGLEEAAVDQPIVIQFVNRILADAINKSASDIHFEPRRDRLDIRYRIDGTLHNVDSIRREFQAACTSRVKVMADMNIAERRLPQDGRIAVTIDGRSVDMRVSSLPTQYGESVVLRILDKGATRPTLDQLGFSDFNLKTMRSLIRKPHGIFLATGPTGSGKTTTLYAAIQEIHTPEVNIITVEDPIEYDLEGIRQSNVHEKAGLTMARQLRAILRQDPDIIYVGEIRDAETAEIAFRAALTGHLVFSTLHCNDAAGAVTRLLNMDVDPFLVASSVVGVLAQRLVRRVCPHCAQPFTPKNTEITAFGLDPMSQEVQRAKFLSGTGCEVCDYTGYKGRYSVQELMSMDDNIRNLVLQRTPSNKIRKAAMQHNMVSMRQDAATKVMQGVTTFEEAAKRVFIDDAEDEPAAHVY